MKMVVPITIDDTNMTTDAVAESYDEWGTDFSLVKYPCDPFPEIKGYIFEDQTDGSLWAAGLSGTLIYKPLGSDSAAVVYTASKQMLDFTRDAYGGVVYITVYDESASTYGDIILYGLDSEFSETEKGRVTLSAEPPAGGPATRMGVDLNTGDVFQVFFDGSDNVVYLYDASEETYSVHATLTAGWSVRGMHVVSDTRDIYIAVYGVGLYKQTSGSGSFDLLEGTDSEPNDWYDVSVDESDGTVWALEYMTSSTNSLYKQSKGTGSFELQTSIQWLGDSIFASSRGKSVFLSYGGRVVYVYSSSIFSKDDYAIYDGRIYYALADSANTEPGTDDTVWFDYGATNPYRMFDGAISTPTTATGSINLTLDNDNVTAIGFFGMTAQEIQVVLTVDAVEVYNETIELRSTEVGDWYEYFFNPINQVKDTVFEDIPAYSSGEFTITISGASVADAVEAGLMIPGYSYDVGNTKRGVKPGFVNYSTTEVDDFGRISIVPRGSAKTLDCECFLDSRAQASAVIDLYNRTKDLKCLWIGSRDADTWSLIYGICKRFDATIEDNNGKYSLQILGVV